MAAHIRTSARQSLVQTRLRPYRSCMERPRLMNSRASANEMPPTDHSGAVDGEMGRDYCRVGRNQEGEFGIVNKMVSA